MERTTAIPETARKALEQATTGMVNDALALIGIQGSVVGIRPIRGFEDAKVIGPASTVFLAPAHPETPANSMYAVIPAQPRGNVLVIDAGGWDAQFTGDNNGHCPKRQGLVGVVVNGGARDVAGFRALGMPLFCTGAATRGMTMQIMGVNVPIVVGGVTIRPDDIIFADEDGVVAIPASLLGTVVERLGTIAEVERGMEAALARDAPVAEIVEILARKKPKR